MKCQNCGGETEAVADNVPQKDGGKAGFVWCVECGSLLKLTDYGHTIRSQFRVPKKPISQESKDGQRDHPVGNPVLRGQ